MEKKKSDKANLENKRGIFLQIGLLTVLSIILIAFEWKSMPDDTSTLGTLADLVIEEEIIPITRMEEVKPPPPPPPPEVIEELNIVEDDKEIENEIDIQDSEADQDTEVEEIEFVEEEEEDNEIYEFFALEDQPAFLGGDLGIWLPKNTTYPQIAIENDISGRVFVGFTIEKDGSVSDVKVLRPVDPYLDREAVRVVKSMPKWSPGKQRGKAVRVKYQVPISFRLSN